MSAALALAVALVLAGAPLRARACTAIAIGHGATVDGAAYMISTADCLDCDFRLARVPAREHRSGTTRSVYSYRAQYPHVISHRARTWEPDNLQGSLEQLRAWKRGGRGTEPIGSVPQPKKTYALIEGGAGYGLLNEKGVGFAESTCIAKFVSSPQSDGGLALLDISELTKLALERSATAREAIQMMGALAEEFGYYGAEWDQDSRYDEAGEALMVSDPTSTWVFHILPDDTGRSAIWAAQRVPVGHVTAVANQFIIRSVDESDTENFLYSANMRPIAVKHGFYDPKIDGKFIDFTRAFSTVRPHSSYSTHRVYRVFTIANPDLIGVLDPYPSALMDGYPFSVPVKKKLTIHDLFSITRDHYEGTPWDMTKSDAAQPFGDPDRYDPGPVGNMSMHEVMDKGEFGRAISMMRTSYTALVRSTSSLPESVGAMLYVAHQAPDSSVFIPIYVAAHDLPSELTVGSLFEFNENSMFWAVTAVSNWVHRYYLHAIGDLRPVQKDFEEKYSVDAIDAKAARLVEQGREAEAQKVMRDFTQEAATTALQTYRQLFPKLIARFHDGYRQEDPSAKQVQMTPLFYSMKWLQRVGYFTMTETGGGDNAIAPLGTVRKKPGSPVLVKRAEYSSILSPKLRAMEHSYALKGRIGHGLPFVVGVVVGVLANMYFGRGGNLGQKRFLYTPIV